MLGGSGIFVKISESSPSLIAFYRSLFALPFLYFWMKHQEINDSSNIAWTRRNIFFLLLGGLCFALDMSIWNWSLSFGFYPGILFGCRAYEEKDHLTYVLYVPFIDVALELPY